MNLPANSTFLPVLDDLLSPDFRPLHLPAQTPQTPTDVVSFGGAKIITNAYGNITGYNASGLPSHIGGRPLTASTVREEAFKETTDSNTDSEDAAASKIQNWWKSRRSVSIDMGAERAKHTIRHNRTEDHIRLVMEVQDVEDCLFETRNDFVCRHLEGEVSRLKTALSSERKIRSLQLEAIRSLWSQLQRISAADSSGANNTSIMTRSVPNGLPGVPEGPSGTNVMSMSLNTALNIPPAEPSSSSSQQQCHEDNSASRCSCTKEVEQLKEVFTQEISQLRVMIDHLTSKSLSNTSRLFDQKEESSADASGEQAHKNGCKSQQQQQKRPLSLNLPGVSNCGNNNSEQQNEPSQNTPTNQGKNSLDEEKIVDYASQMASKLVDDAAKDKENANE